MSDIGERPLGGFSPRGRDMDDQALARQRATKAALVVAAAIGCAVAVYCSPIAQAARKRGTAGALQVLAAANYTANNWGQDCYAVCKGPGLCPDFCGYGNACCRYGSTVDPPECHGIMAWGSLSYHTCVVPTNIAYQVVKNAPPGVQNWGADCWEPCHNSSGYCSSFCGRGSVCCRWNEPLDAPECGGIMQWGSKDRHTCVAVADMVYSVAQSPPNGTNVKNWGEPCLDACNKTGICSEFCGSGNACCKWGDGFQSPACAGVWIFGAKDNFTCVAPVNPDFKLELAPPGVLNWGQDCSAPCDGAGYCQEFCGLGNACCKFQDTPAPPECLSITTWGAKDTFTCVKPESPAYVTATEPVGTNVLNWGQDCMPTCGNPGFCEDFCGEGNACCSWGAPFDPPECHGVQAWGSKDRYTCVAPTNQVYWLAPSPFGETVLNWGKDCWTPCGETGGACPDFCGIGNACCRFGSTQDPPECHAITKWGSKEEHTCVKPVAPYLYVNHFAKDCWKPCDGAGYCESWCGTGNACCRYGRGEDPHECKGVTYFPTHASHTCVKASGLYGVVPQAPVPGSCVPGEVHNAAGHCAPADHPALMTFYMYHAASDAYPSLNNRNLANLPATLMYLQRHVVTSCPRKGNVNRIIRYVVTIRNTDDLFNATSKQFAPYTKFQDGECYGNSTPCSTEFDSYGYVVGCRAQSSANTEYGDYEHAVFYSLPGGGDGENSECLSPNGDWKCTWRAEYAGEVRLDELSGITNYPAFCAAGSVEYDQGTDAGVGTKYWNKRRDEHWCDLRVKYLRQLFAARYPNYPIDLGKPACDSS